MDMGDMGAGAPLGDGPLSPDGVDFSNATQAASFLEDLLNDDDLRIIGNAYARYFWYGVAAVIAVAAVFNCLSRITLRSRLRAASQQKASPARPKSLFSRWFATITAVGREMTYLQFTPTTRWLWFKVPPLGTILLVLSYLGFVLGLEFINNDESTYGAQYWQALGVRAGWLAVAQIPLLILLINKNNIIGLLTGTSYERLNVLHRWTSRVLLLLAIFHFAFQNHGWSKYGVSQLEWTTDDCPPTGIAAFALLLWMNLSTLAPFRYWSYEVFVAQHIVTFMGFIIAIMFHLPSTALWSRIYIYIPVGLYLLDRVLRTLFVAWVNKQVSRATLSQLDGNVIRIRLHNGAIKKWRPGAHVLLSIPRFGIMQSHPATIASTPSSHGGDLIFILKTHKGFTRRLMAGANTSSTALLPHSSEEVTAVQNMQVESHVTLLDGPYGGQHADLAAFDSVCLIAGSTGVTFALANMLYIADLASSGQPLPVRRVILVWCVKDTAWARWTDAEITAACAKLQSAGINTSVHVHVTCADAFTEPGDERKECGCACDKSNGPCCCVVVEEEDEKISADEIVPEGTADKNTKSRTTTLAISSASSVSLGDGTGQRLAVLPCATFYSGRPDIRAVLSDLLEVADGESAVAVCGPVGLNVEVRNTVVRLSDERAIHKGTSAQGCYLHVESFS